MTQLKNILPKMHDQNEGDCMRDLGIKVHDG